MTFFILRRLGSILVTFLTVSILIFLMMHSVEGGPFDAGEMPLPPAVREQLMAQYGLDRPLWEQYLRYLGDVATLDLGESLNSKVSVGSLLRTRLEVSLALIAYATLLTVVVALPLGIAAALRKDGPFDQVVRVVLMVTMVMPAFWVGILLLIVFSVRLGLFPVSGYGEGLAGHLRHLFLPALTVALGIVPILVRSLRGSLLEALASDYVRTARAKGLRDRAVVLGHTLRNALIPPLTLLGLSVGYMMGGTVIVENVFSLPGAGKLLVDSISARDYPVVQSTTLVFAALVILVNLATDVVYTFLDPRVRLG